MLANTKAAAALSNVALIGALPRLYALDFKRPTQGCMGVPSGADVRYVRKRTFLGQFEI
jgi:hypothetical protein